jgi:ribA/ribD-fused uncharacterized protein
MYTLANLRLIIKNNGLESIIKTSGPGRTKTVIYNELLERNLIDKNLPKNVSSNIATKKGIKMVKSSKESLLFFGHTAAKAIAQTGHERNLYLSNWAPSPFTDNHGHEFVSSEQYMMWRKARIFGDKEMAKNILSVATNKDLDLSDKEWSKKMMAIKKMGRQVSNFDQDIWNKKRQGVMYKGLMLKFSQHKPSKRALLKTGDRLIAEAAPRDRIWGIGMSASNPLAQDPKNWKGQNLLGKTLMEVRSALKE